MRKFASIASVMMLGAVGFTASAGVLLPAETVDYYGSVMNGGLVSPYPENMCLSWNDTEIKLTNDACFYLIGPGETESDVDPIYDLYVVGYPPTKLNLYLPYPYTPGDYIVKIPAGIVESIENGDTNTAQEFSFTIVNGNIPTYTPDYSSETLVINPPQSVSGYDYNSGTSLPAPFYTNEELSTVEVSWTGYPVEVTGQGKVTAINEEGTEEDLSNVVNVYNGAIYLKLYYLDPGTWNINIPAGFVKSVSEDDEIYINSSVKLTYIITGNPEPINGFTVVHPTDKYVTQINSVQISFGQPIKIVEDAPEVVCYNSTFDKSYKNKVFITSDYNGVYLLNISMEDDATDPGNYEFTLPEGLVSNGEYENTEESFSLFVLEPVTEYITYPASYSKVTSADIDKVIVDGKEIAQVTVTFPGISEIVDNHNNMGYIQYHIPGQDYVSLKPGAGVEIDGNKIIISIGELQQAEYQISIPETYFVMDDLYTNPRINFQFDVWDGLPEVTVIQAPAEYSYALPDTEILLTWDYQILTETPQFGAKVMYYSNETYTDQILSLQEGDLKLTTIANPDGTIPNGYNAVSLNLKNAMTKFLSLENQYNHGITVTFPQGIIQNAKNQINKESVFKFDVYPESPVPFVLEKTDTEGVYAFSWGKELTWMSRFQYDEISIISGDGSITKLTEGYGSEPAPGEFMRSYFDPVNYTGPNVTFNISNLNDGIYTLSIPEGFVAINIPEDRTDYINAEINYVLSLGDVVAFRFNGENLSQDAFNYVNIMYALQDDEEPTALDIKSDLYEFILEGITNFMISAEEGYEIFINSNIDLEEAEIGSLEEVDGIWYLTLNNVPEEDLLTISVNVAKVIIEPTNVTFEFSGTDIENHPYSYVTVSYGNLNDEEFTPIAINSDSFDFEFLIFPINLKFEVKEGFMISSLYMEEEEYFNAQPASANLDEWDMTIFEGIPDGSQIYIVVEPVITMPVGEETTILFSLSAYDGEASLDNAYEYVIITYEGLQSGFGNVEFGLSQTPDVFIPNVSFNFETVEGYYINEITTDPESEDFIKIVPPPTSAVEGQWGMTVFAGAPDEISVSVVINKSVPTGINYIMAKDGRYKVYNLQGALLLDTEDISRLGSLNKGIYVINGKKVTIK